MLFTEQFQIARLSDDDWFDPILDTDTTLFIDPFLVFRHNVRNWAGAHDELIEHFNRCFHLIADGNRSPASLPYRKALALLTLPEPREFCLGYTDSGTSGAGGGPRYAKLMAQAMSAAIDRGLSSLSHFEELGILNEGIGPDRISDFTCNILKSRFIAYTKEVVRRHNLPTERFRIPGAAYDHARVGWLTEFHELPRNPYNGKAVLLTPEHFLQDLPTLNPHAWWSYYEAEQLATDLNYEILGRVDKQSIVAAARRHTESVREWMEYQEEQPGQAYNLGSDPKGVYQWDSATRGYTSAHPIVIPPPTDEPQFVAVIEQVIEEFKRYVEQQGGWKLLWNDGHIKEKQEEAAQLVFMGLARSYCRANDVVVDREVELGRGPVDFKFSNGYSQRALLEVKKLHNGKFWNGLEAQFPSYLESDDCPDGWFVAVQYFTTGVSKNRRPLLDQAVASTAQRTRRNLRLRHVDASPKESASKLKRRTQTDEPS